MMISKLRKINKADDKADDKADNKADDKADDKADNKADDISKICNAYSEFL
jgi:hypothetical protein